MSEIKRPLEGIKVVELATFIAAPCCARYLADLGAEVIKVEATGGLYAADDAKLSLAIAEQKDTNSFYETGDNADGKATVVGEDAVKYPSLYQAVITMAPGEVRLIHDETASFIVRCDKQYFFESCKDSEELIAYAQELYFKEQFNAARYSGTYTAEKSDSYRSIDIKSFVAEGKKHYGR